MKLIIEIYKEGVIYKKNTFWGISIVLLYSIINQSDLFMLFFYVSEIKAPNSNKNILKHSMVKIKIIITLVEGLNTTSGISS